MANPADASFYAMQLRASQEFLARSSSNLEEKDSDFRPQPDMMSAAQQVAHIAHTLDWFREGMIREDGFDLNFEEHATVLASVTSLQAARTMLEEAFARAIAFVEGMSAEDLASPLPEGPVMGGQPRADALWGMIDHTAHHRGALSVYTRLVGKVPPMPYGG